MVVIIARCCDLPFDPGAAPGGQIEGYVRPAPRTTHQWGACHVRPRRHDDAHLAPRPGDDLIDV